MNIFFLCHTRLKNVDGLTVAPVAGDVVCYVRRAQDATGKAKGILAKKDISVINCEDLLTPEVTAGADEQGKRFLRTWFLDNNDDFSDLGNLSLGTSYAFVLALQLRPATLLRTAIAFYEFISRFPQAGAIFSDALDDMGPFQTAGGAHPLAQIIDHVAIHLNRNVRFLEPSNAVPSAFSLGTRNSFQAIIKSYLGGFRPSWIKASRAFRKTRADAPNKPVFYLFLGRAHQSIARRLAARDDVHVVCSQLKVPGASAVRPDHFFALPSWHDIKIVRKLLYKINTFSKRPPENNRFVLNGIGFDKILFGAVRDVLKIQIWAFLFIVAQSRKFQKCVGPSALLINEACNEPMGNLVMLNRHTELKIYLIPHGMNQSRYTYLTPAVDNSHVTYLSFANDHDNFYYSGEQKPEDMRHVLVGNPLTVDMKDTHRPEKFRHDKRLLVLDYCFSEKWTSARYYAGDQYYIELFQILEKLIEEGWSVSFRPHPYHHHNMESWLAEHFGLENRINWDYSPNFTDALQNKDVVVSNMSSAFYQSLFAGWPTIFYEPDYLNTGSIEGLENDSMYTGLQTARDLERPVTNNPETLASMINDTLDPESMVSTFPKRFAGELAPRFIGPDPANADMIIADFLAKELSDVPASSNSRIGT